MMVQGQSFSFGLPPSLGREPVRELAREFADVLYEAGFGTVIPYASYEELERSLLDGEVDAAWGPPVVCAKVEQNAGVVALRAIRDGSTNYRSVLICRQNDPIEIERIGLEGVRKPRAVWVDEWSMAGYLMPRHHLARSGVSLADAFIEERMMGSYDDCFAEVLDGEADITASYVSRRGAGYVELCGNSAYLLRVLAYTDECPNDAVVLAPQVSEQRKLRLESGLKKLVDTPSSHKILTLMFDVDGFDRPPVGTYAPLVQLIG